MSLNDIFNISGSGMSAQSLRLNTVASNIANAETVASSTDETYPGENKWAGVPPATCKSCEQTTHDVERDSNPDVPHYLLWHKTRTLKNGELGPCGVECYRCFDVNAAVEG